METCSRSSETVRHLANVLEYKGLYASEAEPKRVFGEGTPAYNAFFEAMHMIVPGAVSCRNAFIKAWKPFAKEHKVTLPDGFESVLRTQNPVSYEFGLSEVPNAKYVLHYKAFEGTKRGVSLGANIVHQLDSMIVREMVRRCSYNKVKLNQTYKLLKSYCKENQATDTSQFISLNLIDKIGSEEFDMNTLCRLRDLCKQVLQWVPSPLVCIHDSFASTPNSMNKVRYWYKEILAELADSNILQDILDQLYGKGKVKVEKECPNLGDYIRQSNYALT